MKPIPNFPDYFADELGNIYGSRKPGPNNHHWDTPRLLKPRLKKGLYRQVVLYKNGKAFNMNVHRLVLETFVGSIPEGMICCHGANGVSDNSLPNLYYATYRQNALDKVRDGTDCRGEKHWKRILSEREVLAIRAMYASDTTKSHKMRRITFKSLAAQFGVSHYCISDIVSRKSWSHI